MSTICKLDPMVRVARTARRNEVFSLARALPFIPMARQGAAAVLHKVLDNVRRNSTLTGKAKSDVFAELMKAQHPVSA